MATFQRFEVGAFSCAAISDGVLLSNPRTLFANVDAAALADAIRPYTEESGLIPVSLNCLLVQGEITLLVDTGMGSGSANAGHVLDNLRLAGVTPEQVDIVLLSHAHLDHMSGAVGVQGQPAFPKARYLLSQVEWDYWHTSDDQPGGAERTARIREILAALRPQLDLIPMDYAPRTGIRIIPCPGHTPGQVAVLLESAGQKLLYSADAVPHPLHLAYTRWFTGMDADPAQAISTRVELLRQMADSRTLLFVYHFPFPGLYPPD